MRLKRTISTQTKKRLAIDKILEENKDIPDEGRQQILAKRNQCDKKTVSATYETL